jgi:hypothetical protein
MLMDSVSIRFGLGFSFQAPTFFFFFFFFVFFVFFLAPLQASHYPPGTVPADGLDVPEDPLMSSYSHHTHSVDPIRGGGGGALSRSVLSRSASAAAAAATVKRPNARTTEADVVDTTHDTELPGGCADVIQRHARVVGAVFDQVGVAAKKKKKKKKCLQLVFCSQF